MLMESNKIRELLNRYWQAETSLEEEAQLREYFSRPDLPEEWHETASFFKYLSSSKKKELNDVSFNDRVVSKLEASKKGKMATLVYNSLRIAAGIAVLVLAVWLIHNQVKESTVATNEIEDTYDDPRVAYQETKKALMIISKSFGTAENEARKINLFNEAQQEIRKDPEVSTDL
jgi:hypothetical protein